MVQDNRPSTRKHWLKIGLKKVWLFFGSLKLAVMVILASAILAAIGTFVESGYNAEVAQKLVYYSWWMKGTLAFMAINLIVSAAHRWPWKKRHTGFVVAHAGILIIMIGSVLTGQYGVDGTMFFNIGETRRTVAISEYELRLWVGDETQFIPMYERKVDFLLDSPKKNPVMFQYQKDLFKITDYYPFAMQETEVRPTEVEQAYPALRFQLFNDRVNMTEWIQQTGSSRPGILALGPANVILTSGTYTPSGNNELVLKPEGSGITYEVHSRDKKRKVLKGKMEIGGTIDTGWMGLQFRLLNFHPKAVVKNNFRKLERPTPLTTQAIEVDFNGQKHWLGLNGILKLFSDTNAYILTYSNRQIDVGFDMTLKHFEVGRYQGTMRAAAYESLVEVDGLGERLISMNEPLKHGGFTFYQASFQEDPNTGTPTASILSVNYDPGRFLKYFGSFLIVLGTYFMFWLGDYFKNTSEQK